jgi:hypothetical protein
MEYVINTEYKLIARKTEDLVYRLNRNINILFNDIIKNFEDNYCQMKRYLNSMMEYSNKYETYLITNDGKTPNTLIYV